MSMSPRYTIVSYAPRYGGRDEIVGHVCHVEGTAFTRAWANHLAARIADEWGEYTDIGVDVVDSRPGELDPTWPLSSQWSPQEDDLPF